MSEDKEMDIETIAETENFTVWKSTEADGEDMYHLDLGIVTVHLFIEEWQELMELMQDAMTKTE